MDLVILNKAKQAAGSSSSTLPKAPTITTGQGSQSIPASTENPSSAGPATSSAGHPHPPATVQPGNGVHVVHSTNATDNPQTEVLNPRRAPWMAKAEEEYHAHIKRNGGVSSDEHIREYFNETSFKQANVHTTSYCAAFVNWCLARVGITGTNSAGAASFSTYGRSTKNNKPAYGAICVITFPHQSVPHHVTFCNGKAQPGRSGPRIATLGGNQGDAHEVSASALPESWVTHYRFPPDYFESDDDYDLKLVGVDGSSMSYASTH